MVKITLNKIKAHNPCESGWEKITTYMKAKGVGIDDEFPFSEILESNDLDDAIWAMQCLDDKATARLFAVACCQEVLHLIDDKRSDDAVRISHLHVYGEASDKELAAARAAAWNAACDAAWAAAGSAAWNAAKAVARAAARDAAWSAAWNAACDAARAAAWVTTKAAVRDAARAAARKRQASILKSIFDNYEVS